MSSTHERAFELEITKVATHMQHSDLIEYQRTVADETTNKDDRLYAYCVVFTYYRRQKDINKCIDLFEKYSFLFPKEFIVLHYFSIAVKETGRRKDLIRSIELARESLSIQPRHVGALHNLAGSLFLLAEEDGSQKESSRILLNEARDNVEEAIDLESGYPKFYATKAEILSALGDHKSALREVTKAIDKEDSNSSDYPLRISDYLSRKMKIELRRSITSVSEESRRELKEAMDEARKSNLEILSFFVAIISFIVAGINITVKFSFAEAVQLLFVLSATMLMAVSGFILLFDSHRSFIRFLQAFIVALVMLLIAFGAQQLLFGYNVNS